MVRKVETNAIISAIEHLAAWGGVGGMGLVFVGSPSTVANILEEWVAQTDVDGFNFAYAVAHETFEDIVRYLVPELQRHGAYRTTYKPGTLREKLLRDGPRLPSDHPAARFRDIEAIKRAARPANAFELGAPLQEATPVDVSPNTRPTTAR